MDWCSAWHDGKPHVWFVPRIQDPSGFWCKIRYMLSAALTPFSVHGAVQTDCLGLGNRCDRLLMRQAVAIKHGLSASLHAGCFAVAKIAYEAKAMSDFLRTLQAQIIMLVNCIAEFQSVKRKERNQLIGQIEVDLRELR